KKYRCLVPGCARTADRCHSIPRALCLEALAEEGVLYTQQQSFNSILAMESPFDAQSIVETGINKAGIFNGFCSKHDARLFAGAETKTFRRKWYFIALHCRALSLEYCRKRTTADFLSKLAALTVEPKLKEMQHASAHRFRLTCTLFRKTYLDNM